MLTLNHLPFVCEVCVQYTFVFAVLLLQCTSFHTGWEIFPLHRSWP